MKLARTLMSVAMYATPAESREWAEAVKAELDHVPPSKALSFAAGGLVMALCLRLQHPSAVPALTRYGLAAAALVWAGLHLRLAIQLTRADPSLPTLLTFAPTLMFVVGGMITAVAGLRFTSLVGLLTLPLVALYAAAAGHLLRASPQRAFYQAVALEDAVVVIAAVLLAASVNRHDQERRGRGIG